ncbi:TPA: helix-turn-helix transcriptional regulator [Clostridium botulinum]|nr:helix-turn-helix transcriptional regulator [Clostridium botulinum]
MHDEFKKSTNDTIGTRIFKLRHLKSMSLQDLANKTGIHKSTLSKYERGEIIPRKNNLNKMLRILNQK